MILCNAVTFFLSTCLLNVVSRINGLEISFKMLMHNSQKSYKHIHITRQKQYNKLLLIHIDLCVCEALVVQNLKIALKRECRVLKLSETIDFVQEEVKIWL